MRHDRAIHARGRVRAQRPALSHRAMARPAPAAGVRVAFRHLAPHALDTTLADPGMGARASAPGRDLRFGPRHVDRSGIDVFLAVHVVPVHTRARSGG